MDGLRRIGDVAHQRGETARRRDDTDLAVSQAGVVKTLGHERGKLLDGVVERRGGHLLDTDLKQEITGLSHVRPPPPSERN